MSRDRVEDTPQANRLRWFLAAHLLAVLAIFEASLWVGRHLASRPEPIPTTTAPPAASREQWAAAAPQPPSHHHQESP